MSYQESLEKVSEEHTGLEEIIELTESLGEGDRALVFSHDDPDGYGATGILCSYFDNKGVEYQLDFPHRFDLTKPELNEVLDEFGEVDALFITDKGTLPHNDELAEIMEPVVDIRCTRSPPLRRITKSVNLMIFLP